MTREQAKELLPIIQAFAEGKIVQVKGPDNRWYDRDKEQCEIHFNSDPQKYRIKPEPTYRPFANEEECWNEMLKHQPFGYIQEEGRATYAAIFYITRFNIETFDNYYSYKDASKLFFADGTPFGIKEE